MKYFIFLLFFLHFHQLKSQELFNQEELHEIRITFKEQNFWSILNDNYTLSQTLEENFYLMANIEIDGIVVDSVGVRQKGEYSHKGFPGKKKPLKIDFNEFVGGKKFQGLKKINLANFAADPSMMRDMLSYKIHELKGNTYCETSYTKVYLNEEFWGLYLIVEQIDKTFLKKNFGENDGNLYKSITRTGLRWEGNDFEPYSNNIELKTNKTKNDHAAFINFIDILNNRPEEIESVFDMESFLSILSVDVVINNWDSYYDNERNFYLYLNPNDNKFHYIPWDYNLSFWAKEPTNLIPIKPDITKPLLNLIENNRKYKQLYFNNFCKLLETVFIEEKLYPVIDDIYDLISEEIKLEENKFYSADAFNINIETSVNVVMPRNNVNKAVLLPGLKEFIQVKRQKIRELLVEVKANCYFEKARYIAFPNPTEDIVKFDLEGKHDKIISIYVYNYLGAVIEIINKPESLELDLSNYQKGIYNVVINHFNTEEKNIKIIKK
ncbi:MAG: spore coat protein H [Flavobacteriaceae bacterium]|jgi:spore coat protein H